VSKYSQQHKLTKQENIASKKKTHFQYLLQMPFEICEPTASKPGKKHLNKDGLT